jgi:putative thioredoxin
MPGMSERAASLVAMTTLEGYEHEMRTTNGNAGESAYIIDVTEATFEAEVLQRSMTTPVVIDLWADWCGPCHQLAPVLEQAVAARNGDVVLARIDVDANQALAAALGVQGIPAVKAVVGGRLVAEFVGVQPKAAVERFLDQIAPRRAPEPAVPEAPAVITDETIKGWQETLATEPGNAEARIGLAKVALGNGDHAEALKLLGPVEHEAGAAPLLAAARLAATAADDGSEFAEAAAKATAGSPEAALESLLAAVRSGDGDRRDGARRLMLDVFKLLGDDDPRTMRYRRGLMTALY